MYSIKIADRVIGKKHPPLFLPEIGTFFNQDINLAKELIENLVASGAEMIKGEILHNVDIALDVEFTAEYYSSKKGVIRERYRDLIARKVVPLSHYEEIFGFCRSENVPFILSVYDFEGATFARDIGASAIKIASSNIVHHPLIEFVSKLGLPIIMDTGCSTFAEISRAVEWLRSSGCSDLLIEHSPAAPPAPASSQNLRILRTFQDAFSAPVGLSDHYHGNEMLYIAIALGAGLLEKGVMPSGGGDEQDASHAMPIRQVKEVIECCAACYESLGAPTKPAPQSGHPARMGLVASRDLREGDTIDLTNVSFAWPAIGIGVEHWKLVVGSKIIGTINKGQIVDWKNVLVNS